MYTKIQYEIIDHKGRTVDTFYFGGKEAAMHALCLRYIKDAKLVQQLGQPAKRLDYTIKKKVKQYKEAFEKQAKGGCRFGWTRGAERAENACLDITEETQEY